LCRRRLYKSLRQGKARQGKARQGKARQGKARQGKARFKNIDPITDNEVAELITKISERVLKYLRKQGYLNNEGEIVTNPCPYQVCGPS